MQIYSIDKPELDDRYFVISQLSRNENID